jgi:hypothetical protein
LNLFAVGRAWLGAVVDGLQTHILQVDGVVLLETLLGENFIDTVNEIPPADMFALLRRFERSGQ